MKITRGLIIADPWISYILEGTKTWEMRSTSTSHRGWFGLIRKGSGEVHGIAHLVDCGLRLSNSEMLTTIDRHRIPERMIRSGEVAKWVVPWKLEDVQRLPEPVPYTHRSGAVTWVNFDHNVQDALSARLHLSPRSNTPSEFIEASALQPAATKVASTGPMREVSPSAKREWEPAQCPVASTDRVIGRTKLSSGNIRNNHFYLKELIDEFPPDVIGGSNKASKAPRDLSIDWGGSSPVRCDIDKSKRLFRSRGWVGSFFSATGASEGDDVVIYEVAPYEIRVRLEKKFASS